uniref:Integrase n=1 Tax=Caenorhabditis japonica TaxID=281687 RepID=A0A8R1DE69_CAEJA
MGFGWDVDHSRCSMSACFQMTKNSRRYAGACAIPDKKAETVAKAFADNWMLNEGRIPKAILTDQGLEFANAVFEKLAKMSNIKLIRTKGYHSRMNGAVERFNRTIQTVLKKITIIPAEWDEKLPYAVFAYNACKHDATGESPHFIMYGRDVRIPMKEDLDEQIGKYQVDLDEYKYRHVEQMKIAQEEARKQVRKEQQDAKKWFDENNQVGKIKFPVVGDRVLVKILAEKLGATNPKLVNEWQGPYRILATSKNSAEVVQVMGGEKKMWVPWEQLRAVPKEMPEAQWETKANRGRRCAKIGVATNSVQRSGKKPEQHVENVYYFSSLMKDGCGCKKAPCHLTIGEWSCASVEEVAVTLAMRNTKVNTEDRWLMPKAEESRKRVGEEQRKEALALMAATCKEVAVAIMAARIPEEFRKSAAEVEKNVETRMAPKKTVIRSKHIILASKIDVKDECILEVRHGAMDKWPKDYELGSLEEKFQR